LLLLRRILSNEILSTYDPRRKKKQFIIEDMEAKPTKKMTMGIEVDNQNGEYQ
jgi:hypothetical protein